MWINVPMTKPAMEMLKGETDSFNPFMTMTSEAGHFVYIGMNRRYRCIIGAPMEWVERNGMPNMERM